MPIRTRTASLPGCRQRHKDAGRAGATLGGTASNEALRILSTSSDNAGVEGTHGELSNSKPSFPHHLLAVDGSLVNADIKPHNGSGPPRF